MSTPATRGRRRDPSRDGAILDAALEVIGEVGYEGMTIEMVAARAKAGKATVYRRWSSKADLVDDAVVRLGRDEVDRDALPDTGTLRGDLVALIRPEARENQERKLRVMAGLSARTLKDPEFARSLYDAVNGQWVEVNRLLMRRAIERGELPADAPIDVLSKVLPSMIAFRFLVERRSDASSGAYIRKLIDTVLLPAVGIPPGER